MILLLLNNLLLLLRLLGLLLVLLMRLVRLEFLVLHKTRQHKRQRRARHTAVKRVVQRHHKAVVDPLALQLAIVRNQRIVLCHLQNMLVRGKLGPERRLELVVEDRTYDRNAKDLSQNTDKLHQHGHRCHVLWFRGRLHGQGRGLDCAAHTHTAEQQHKHGNDTLGILGEEHTEPRSHGEEEVAHGGEESVRAALEDPDAGARRCDRDAHHHRYSLEATDGGGLILYDLEVDGQVEQDAKEGHAAKEQGRVSGPEVADLEQVDGHGGLLGHFPLDENKGDRGEDTPDKQSDDHGRVPGVLAAAPAQREQDHDHGAHEDNRAQDIDALDLVRQGALWRGKVQEDGDEDD